VLKIKQVSLPFVTSVFAPVEGVLSVPVTVKLETDDVGKRNITTPEPPAPPLALDGPFTAPAPPPPPEFAEPSPPFDPVP
jgi:hypothetical protein